MIPEELYLQVLCFCRDLLRTDPFPKHSDRHCAFWTQGIKSQALQTAQECGTYWWKQLSRLLFHCCGKTPWLKHLEERVRLGLRYQSYKSLLPLQPGARAAGRHGRWDRMLSTPWGFETSRPSPAINFLQQGHTFTNFPDRATNWGLRVPTHKPREDSHIHTCTAVELTVRTEALLFLLLDIILSSVPKHIWKAGSVCVPTGKGKLASWVYFTEAEGVVIRRASL